MTENNYYKVQVQQTLTRVIEVEAKNEDDAFIIAKKKAQKLDFKKCYDDNTGNMIKNTPDIYCVDIIEIV